VGAWTGNHFQVSCQRYVLCVKDNYPKLAKSILLAQAGVGGKLAEVSRSDTTTGHGRTEVRRCRAFDAVDRLYKAEQWQDLKSFAIVERERIVASRATTERRYYITSLPADTERIAQAVRSHREVENPPAPYLSRRSANPQAP